MNSSLLAKVNSNHLGKKLDLLLEIKGPGGKGQFNNFYYFDVDAKTVRGRLFLSCVVIALEKYRVTFMTVASGARRIRRTEAWNGSKRSMVVQLQRKATLQTVGRNFDLSGTSAWYLYERVVVTCN